MRQQLRQYAVPIAIAAAIVICLYAQSPNFRYASGPSASPYAGDFLQEWLGGWIVRAGDHARFYDVEYVYRLQHDESLVSFAWNEDEYLPIVYPPFYYLVISPLSLVPFHVAAWIWAALMLAALAGSIVLLHSHVRWRSVAVEVESERQRRPWKAIVQSGWLIPAAVLFQPVLESLSSSQKGTLCLLIFTATYVLWRGGRTFAAGATFGMIAFKPQLALVMFVVAVWQRQWRLLAGMATTGVVLLALSLCLGVDVCWQYVQFALGTGEYMRTSGYDLHKSHSIWGFAQLLMPDADTSLRVCISLLLASLVFYQLSRLFKSDENELPLQFSGIVIATVLLSPHLFTYDLTVLLLPTALILWHSKTTPATRWTLAALFVAPAISTAVAGAIGLQITVPLMLILLSALARMTAAVYPRQEVSPIKTVAAS